MKNSRYILFLLTVLLVGISYSLVAIPNAGSDSINAMKELRRYYKSQYAKMDYTDKEINLANAEILSIKRRPLVVRLKTNSRQINSYRTAGNVKTADMIELKTLKQNLNIISACIRLYNYSQLYFMDVDDQLTFRNSDSLIFSHLLFEKDTSIHISHDSVYFLDFGPLFGRTQANEWKYSEYGDSKESGEIVEESAFVIRNAKNEQLTPPTPSSALVLFHGGKKSKDNLTYLTYDVDLFGPNNNSVIRDDFQYSNEYDAALNRLNTRLYHCYSLLVNRPELVDNFKLWIENNPNKYLYPLWINVEKKLLSIQEKAGGQFTKTN